MSSSENPAGGGVIEYPFPIEIVDRNYRVFPDELEREPLTAFHGTSELNLRSILEEGFRAAGQLESHSFARSSALALGYACKRRSQESPNGGIVAVRFSSLEGVVEEAFGFHVHDPQRLPEIVGYCIVPASYRHV